MALKKIKIKTTIEELIIVVPIKLMKHCAENHPEMPVVIHDEWEFAEQVKHELEHNLGNQDGGNTGLQNLLDAAFEAVATGGHDFVELKDDEPSNITD